jgi:hypothetical protein
MDTDGSSSEVIVRMAHKSPNSAQFIYLTLLETTITGLGIDGWRDDSGSTIGGLIGGRHNSAVAL